MKYNSSIISFTLYLYQTIRNICINSAAAKTLDRFASWIESMVAQSGTMTLIAKKSYLYAAWENSLAYRLLNSILNAPINIMHRFYSGHKAAFEESLLMRILEKLLNRLETIFAVAVVFILIVPHPYWNNLYGPAIALMLVFLYALKSIFSGRPGFSINSVHFSFVLFVAAIVMAQVTSLFPMESIRFFLFYLVSFALVLLIVSFFKTLKSLEKFIEVILVGVSITGLYGLYQRIVGVPFDPSLTDPTLNEGMAGRIYSTMGNPNNYAEILVLALPMFIWAILRASSITKRITFSVLAIPPLFALFATGSRSAWISFAGAVMLFVFLRNWRLLPLMLLAGILCFPLLPIISMPVYKRIMTIFNPNDTSIGYRELIYKTVEPMLKDFWPTGVGLGAGSEGIPFRRVLLRYSFYYLKGEENVPAHTHNLFLQIVVETGIAGLLAFLWFVINTARKCIYHIVNKTEVRINNILIAGLSSVIGVLIMGTVEHIWFYPRVMFFFWIVTGIVLAALNILSLKERKNA